VEDIEYKIALTPDFLPIKSNPKQCHDVTSESICPGHHAIILKEFVNLKNILT